VRLTSTPVTPEKLFEAIQALRKKQGSSGKRNGNGNDNVNGNGANPSAKKGAAR